MQVEPEKAHEAEPIAGLELGLLISQPLAWIIHRPHDMWMAAVA